MPAYRFYFLDSGDHIKGVEVLDCVDDADAHRQATALLQERPGFATIEVWRAKDMVHRVPR